MYIISKMFIRVCVVHLMYFLLGRPT